MLAKLKQNFLAPRSPEAQAAALAEKLSTVCDFVRYAERRFRREGLSFGHGTGTAFDEAVFLVMETLNLPPDTALDSCWNRRLNEGERRAVADIVIARAVTRKPAPYLTNRAWIQGLPFYIDERVIVPRSFIGELLCAEDGFSPPGFPENVRSALDLCTGSGCLAILASHVYPGAKIDAADLSPEALAVAKRNVAEHKLGDTITLFGGDLFVPLEGRTYDLIITNPPYVDETGMESLPPEYRFEPALALAAGHDGLDIIHRILGGAARHLNEGGGLLCEVGRGRENLEHAYPRLPFLWLDTAGSAGEVFWLTKKHLT